MSFSPRSGLNGTVTIGSTELPIIRWNSAPNCQIIPFINSLSGGHPVILPGITDGGLFTFAYDWDDSNNPFGSPLTIKVGVILANIRLYIDGSGGTRYKSAAQAVVVGTPLGVDVPPPSKIGGSVAAMISGAWAEIGQSAS